TKNSSTKSLRFVRSSQLGKAVLLILDNYDSFTYNLVQYFGELGCEPVVRRNDAISVDEIAKLKPAHICISPGPGRPAEAGISEEVVLRFAPSVPLLGVCLGHQCIAGAFGGKVGQAKRLMPGTPEKIHPVGVG